MKYILLLLLISISVAPVGAQVFDYSTEVRWADSMRPHIIPDRFQRYPAVIVLDERIRTYETSSYIEVLGKPKKAVYAMYTRHHRIVRIQDDGVAPEFSRIVIPLPDGELVEDLRWRILRPDGSVVKPHQEFYKDSMASGIDYKLFDLDGLNGKGSELEYSYTIDKAFSEFGTVLFGKESYPVLESRFVLSVGDELKTLIKGYNGFQMGPEQKQAGRNVFAGYAMDLPPLSKEAYSLPLRALPYLNYDLISADINNPMDHTWERFAYRLVPGIINHTHKEEQAARDWVKGHISVSDTGIAQRIRVVEDYVKSRPPSGDLHGVLSSYSSLFEALHIAYEIVFPGDRNGISPDPDLSVWGGLNNPLLYFPVADQYLDPVDQGLRCPYFNPLNAGVLGLFMKTDYSVSFRTILPLPADSNTMTMSLDLQFNIGKDTVLIDRKVIYNGYLARHPQLRDTVMQSAPLVRAAGDTLKLYVGTLIGIQPETVQEGPRLSTVDLYFPYEEKWTIVLHIPSGYTVRNAADLKKATLFKDADGPSMGFVSECVQKGDRLELVVRKGFLRLQYPVTQWENFIDVVQSAEDFNGVQIELIPSGKG